VTQNRRSTGLTCAPRAEEERQRRRNEEIARIQSEKEEERLRLENEKKSSGGGKWVFGLIIIFAVLALGWYGTQGSSSSAISTPQKTIPSGTATPIITTKATSSTSSDQKTISNSIGMEFVSIPAGEFDMGSPSSDSYGADYERPVHRVKISNSFYMGKYEVTQKQWRDVMGNDPSSFKGDNLPVESVSWNDVQDFIKKLNEKEGGNKYRLQRKQNGSIQRVPEQQRDILLAMMNLSLAIMPGIL
jgi:formylglycine-generating enzyme required for sulfatase activity